VLGLKACTTTTWHASILKCQLSSHP
jgi:hypothetical protein